MTSFNSASEDSLYKSAANDIYAPALVLPILDGRANAGEYAFDGNPFAAAIAAGPYAIFLQQFRFCNHTFIHHISNSAGNETVPGMVGIR